MSVGVWSNLYPVNAENRTQVLVVLWCTPPTYRHGKKKLQPLSRPTFYIWGNYKNNQFFISFSNYIKKTVWLELAWPTYRFPGLGTQTKHYKDKWVLFCWRREKFACLLQAIFFFYFALLYSFAINKQIHLGLVCISDNGWKACPFSSTLICCCIVDVCHAVLKKEIYNFIYLTN